MTRFGVWIAPLDALSAAAFPPIAIGATKQAAKRMCRALPPIDPSEPAHNARTAMTCAEAPLRGPCRISISAAGGRFGVPGAPQLRQRETNAWIGGPFRSVAARRLRRVR